MKTAIEFQTAKGATFTGEKNGSDLIIKGAKFHITTNLLYTSDKKEAQTFLAAMNIASPATQIKLELTTSEFQRLESLLRPEVVLARKVSENKIAAIFQTAKETGLPQLIMSNSYETSGAYIQVVNKHTYAMPDGTKKIVTEETH